MAMRSLVVIILVFGLLACGDKAAQEQQKPEVFVVSAIEQPYKPSRIYSARIESENDVDIMAQVSGKLVNIHFEEGDEVIKGAPLFDIDPEPFEAELAQVKAKLNSAEADFKVSKKNYDRAKGLVKDGHISAIDFDKLTAKKLEAEANLNSVKAMAEAAEVKLNFASIKAPIDGRLARSLFAIGDLVGPDYGPLTTLVGEGDMQVVFHLSEKFLLKVKNPDNDLDIKNISVSLLLEDGSQYDHTADVTYIANRVDPATGTIEARVDMPNPEGLLRPGMFVRAVLSLKTPRKSIVVPQASVQVDQQGSYVLTVDEQNKVVRKNIDTDKRIGENVLVLSGLQLNDRVIVRGIQKVRPGNEVIVSEFIPATGSHDTKAQ